MNYRGISQNEMVLTIHLDRVSRQAYLCSTWPEWSRKLERLLYGSPKKATQDDWKVISAIWMDPFTAIRLRRPSPGRAWTVEQRREATDRLQKACFPRGRTVRPVV